MTGKVGGQDELAVGDGPSVPIDRRFHALAARTGKLVYEYDVGTGAIAWSGAIAELTGYSPGEFAATDLDRWAAMIHPDDRPHALALLDEAQRLVGSYAVEYRFARKDGGYRVIDDQGVFLPDERGHARLMIGTMGDVTAAREAARALRDSEARYRRFVQMSVEGVWRCAIEPPIAIALPVDEQARLLLARTTIAECNDAFVRQYGYQRAEQVIGRPLREFWAGAEAEQLALLSLLVTSDYRVVDLEIEERGADGQPVFTLNNLIGVIEGGLALGAWGTQRDVTAMRLAERERARLAVVLEATSDLVGMAEPSGRPIYLNRAGRRMLGLADGAAMPEHIGEVHPRWARDMVLLEGVPAAIATGEWSGATAMLDATGHEIPVSQLLMAHRDSTGAVEFLSTIARDQRERLVAEAEQARLEAQLVDAHKMDALGTLAAGLAHDFANLLTAIGAHVELIARGRMGPDEVQAAAGDVRGAIRRATELVRQLLAFARRESPHHQPLALAPVLHEAVRLLRPSMPPPVVLELELAAELPEVVGDPGQLHQILINLVKNAQHAVGTGAGRIEVRLDTLELSADRAATLVGLRPGRHVRLTVTDDGSGMDAATRARVFEPFFSTRAGERGSGMGLAMVHALVAAHHGAITVESTPGRGSTFAIYLPALGGAVAPRAPRIALAGPARVLLVDDELAALRAVAGLLEAAGCTVDARSDPLAALAALAADPAAYDLLLTDFAMPRASGAELIARAHALRPELPAILCTGADPAALAALPALAAVTILRKPVELAGLEAALGAALGAAPSAS